MLAVCLPADTTSYGSDEDVDGTREAGAEEDEVQMRFELKERDDVNGPLRAAR
jgi:hypothetical protein